MKNNRRSVCGHGLLCTRLACQQPKPLKLSRRDAKTFVEALLAEEIHTCPVCQWQDGSHNSRCWIGALAIKWREAEANKAHRVRESCSCRPCLDAKALAGELAEAARQLRVAEGFQREIRAALADGGVMPKTLLDGVQLVVRERAEYSRKYHEAEKEIRRLRDLLAEGEQAQ